MAQPESPATILVVDDERGPRESLRLILEPSYRVRTATNGASALDVLRRTAVDVVTLDLVMPGIPGQALLRAIRRDHPDAEVVVITGRGTVESAAAAVRYGVSDYLEKPFDMIQLIGAVERAIARGRSRRGLARFLEGLGQELGLHRDVSTILGDEGFGAGLRARLGALLRRATREDRAPTAGGIEFLEVLAETIESKDRHLRGHGQRVSHYAAGLARHLGIDTRVLEQVRIAGFLHDVGKVGVPTDLLLRPGALDAAERKLVEEHPGIGSRLVEPLGLPARVLAAIHHHHEWWNGDGYPDGLAGEAIPLAARIIQVTDAFDAMTCDRAYRRALPRAFAREEIVRWSGIQFDPSVARPFVELLDAGAFDAEHAGDPAAGRPAAQPRTRCGASAREMG